MTCRWNRDAEDYLTDDGTPCRRDDYGDPTRHCTSRRTCSQHIGEFELTCARCLSRARQSLRQIVLLSPLMMFEAIDLGTVETEAVNLAGPAADVEAWSWRKVAAKQGRSWHQSMVEEDDEQHPETVLTRWAQMLTEDYKLMDNRPDRWNLSNAAGFLERILNRLAQDPGQDFRLFRDEIRTVRNHLDSVLSNSQSAEKGAPCPACIAAGEVVRLQRVYAHWCADEDCEQQYHPVTDDFDEWHCPRNRDHWWTAAGYAELIDERRGA